MTHYPYLIIGGGMTCAAAANGIRELDDAGTIGLISVEPEPPYDRPPLSKKLWDGKKTIDEIYVKLPGNVQPHFGRRVVALDPAARRSTTIAPWPTTAPCAPTPTVGPASLSSAVASSVRRWPRRCASAATT